MVIIMKIRIGDNVLDMIRSRHLLYTRVGTIEINKKKKKRKRFLLMHKFFHLLRYYLEEPMWLLNLNPLNFAAFKESYHHHWLEK